MTAERLDRFMARANAIYYATHDPFADFTTSPEISQIFGEIVGLWAGVAWQYLGRPDPVLLVEAGPGRGTLMADALRAVRRALPDFAAALRVHFIETSVRLRAAQAAKVADATWHDSLDSVPRAPMVLLGNEFLDALPIRQYVRRGSGWTERYVADGAFIEHRADLGDTPFMAGVANGAIVEVNEPARGFIAAIAERLRQHLGAALFVDYGSEQSGTGDTLQAIGGGRKVDPLSRPPGSVDLTAHVDFAALVRIARAAGVGVQGPVTQGSFLSDLGLFERTEALAGSRLPGPAEDLRRSSLRLASPSEMGTLFKVLALVSPGCGALPGFSGRFGV